MEVDGKSIEFDKDGFMIEPSLWNDDVARVDCQAVRAGHGFVGIGDKQQISALQIHAIRAADRNVVADEVQTVDRHVVAGSTDRT